MKKFVVSIFALILSSCATTQNFSAANDILALANALLDNNYGEAKRYIDKEALKSQAFGIIRNTIIDKSSKNLGNSLLAQGAAIKGADLLEPVIEALANEVFEAKNLSYFAHKAGLNQNLTTPSKFKAGLALNTVSEGRVCIPDPNTKQCLLYFGKYENVWKLNGFNEIALYNRYEERIKEAGQNLGLKL